MRWTWFASIALWSAPTYAERMPVTCDNASTEDLAIDGLLDEWPREGARKIGVASDGQLSLRCTWDGQALGLALDIVDDKLVRIARGPGTQDHVTIKVAAGAGAPILVDVYPGNAMAKPKITKPARVKAADSLQPKGFSVEALVPASALAGFSAATPSLALDVTFVDADRATGGDTSHVGLEGQVVLAERANLLEDFLRAVRLKKSDLRFDQLVDVDAGRPGTERIVAGGTVIGVLTDQFAYVALPAARASDVKKIELLPLGPRGTRIVAATVRQAGNGGAREMLMMWTVVGGTLHPLRNIELRKEMGASVLSSTWTIEKSKKGAQLVVRAAPAVGFTAETWNEAPAEDADAILVPWDRAVGGAVYVMDGEQMARKTLPAGAAQKKR